jgi:hypothetical protein
MSRKAIFNFFKGKKERDVEEGYIRASQLDKEVIQYKVSIEAIISQLKKHNKPTS